MMIISDAHRTQIDVRRRKRHAGAKHIQEIDRKFDVLVNKLVCTPFLSSIYRCLQSSGFAGPAIQTSSQKARTQKNPLNPKQYRAGLISSRLTRSPRSSQCVRSNYALSKEYSPVPEAHQRQQRGSKGEQRALCMCLAILFILFKPT